MAGFGGPRNAATPQGPGQVATASGRVTGARPPQANQGGFAPPGGRGAITLAGENWDVLDPNLVQYLLKNQGAARYLVATTTSTYASIFMLATEQPALALGGYQGWDRILTPQGLAGFVASGEVRFFSLGTTTTVRNGTAGASSQDATIDLAAWVRSHCSVVPAEQVRATSGRLARPRSRAQVRASNGTTAPRS